MTSHKQSAGWRMRTVLQRVRARLRSTDLGALGLLALAIFALHMLTNGQYGFHRDELAAIDYARHLDWGFVDYPPLTPLLAGVALELFGPSLVGVRLFAALAHSLAVLLSGLMTRELGGSRTGQIIAALAAGIAPIAMAGGAMLTYSDFDYFWWVLIAYLMIRLLKADDPRWWLGIGVAFGLGLETKYTILVWAAAVAAGVILTRGRRHLSSPWLWAGAALALLLFLPNLIWQAQHDFISLDFMRSIHARDIRIGRTADFIPEQLLFCANPVALPLWAAGLTTYLFLPAGKRYRLLGWMAVIAFGLLVGLQGRSYYFAPVYPMLIAQGAVTWHKGLARLSRRASRLLVAAALGTLAIGAAGAAAIALPIAPINSELWRVTSEVHDIFVEQVGWPELVETVADIYNSLPAEDRQQAGILTGNYGEAGAINLYGPAQGLPEAISGVNSYWLRGHGDPPPQVLIVLDWHNFVDFEGCELAGSVANRFGVRNEETGHPTIYICRQLRQPWPVFWQRIKSFA